MEFPCEGCETVVQPSPDAVEAICGGCGAIYDRVTIPSIRQDRTDLEKSLNLVGVGVVDVALERMDKKAAKAEPLKNVRAKLTAEQKLYSGIFEICEDIPAVPQDIWLILATLCNPKEQMVLQLRFGRFGHSNTLQAVGDVMGLSRGRIRAIAARALRRLRHSRRARVIKAMVLGKRVGA